MKVPTPRDLNTTTRTFKRNLDEPYNGLFLPHDRPRVRSIEIIVLTVLTALALAITIAFLIWG